MITVEAIVGLGCQVGDDRGLVVVIVNIATQDGNMGNRVARLTLCFRPGKSTVDCHVLLKLEGGVPIGGISRRLVRTGCSPDLVAGASPGQCTFQGAGIRPTQATAGSTGHGVAHARSVHALKRRLR